MQLQTYINERTNDIWTSLRVYVISMHNPLHHWRLVRRFMQQWMWSS